MKTETIPDVHSYGKRLQLCIDRIDNETFATDDKQLVRSYLKHMGAQGVSKGRVFKITWTLLTLRRHLACNFREADRAIIGELMDWLNGTELSANTKSDHKKIPKKFYKYVRNGNADKDTPIPKEVSWIYLNQEERAGRDPRGGTGTLPDRDQTEPVGRWEAGGNNNEADWSIPSETEVEIIQGHVTGNRKDFHDPTESAKYRCHFFLCSFGEKHRRNSHRLLIAFRIDFVIYSHT